ncbi:alpha/beta hydrolase [Pseudogracilibacillus sp. SO30301A]|uniref:alpha/beta hydrolase n=1 Tax=Pseudogracilibacillus sp. SO30301A TaxID=3098291 RepID=UPI00300DCDCF
MRVKNFITTNKGSTFYIFDSPGKKGTIIAVHGLTGNHKQFYHFQKAFTGEYRFISYDMKGRGNSDHALAETSIFTHAEDLVDLIETLEIERPILMGYSMGAYLSALVASRLPQVEALILLDGAGEADETTRQLVLPSLKRLEKIYPFELDYVEEVKNLYTNLNVQWNDVLAENVKYDIKKVKNGWKHKSNPGLIKQDFESFYRFEPDKVCTNISCETFLLIATGKILGKSPLFQNIGYNKTREAISNIEVHNTDVNHYELIFNKQPEIIERISKFLTTRGGK